MHSKYWFLIDFFIGFIFGLIILYFFKKIQYILKKNKLIIETKETKHYLINSSSIWMYELRNEIYNPYTFTFSMTNICLIEIYKNILFIFQPIKEPNHKLNDDKLYSKVNFNQVRIYNLNNATIGLLPINIIRSKYWSKKFPIVLENILYLGNEFIQTSSFSSINLSILLNKINKTYIEKTLFLFTRTRRSKEDWFYRFINASQINLWKKEIHYQLEQHQIIDNSKQILMTENSHKKKPISMGNNDLKHKKYMIYFLKQTDRFAPPDQLPYLKSMNVKQKFLPNFKKINIKKQLLNFSQKNIYNKQEYCEQWLNEQNQMDRMIKEDKEYYSNRDINTNYTESKLSQLSLETNSNQLEYKTHSLLFFVLKYLLKIPYNTIENNVDNPILLINIFAARCFLDFFDNEQYIERIKIFLQKQLQKIKIPFVEYITITNLNLGDRLPEIKDIYKPWIDEHGLWSHINILYNGKFQLTLNIKLKLIRKNRFIENMPLSNSKRKINLEKNNKTIIHKQISIKKSWRQRLCPFIHWFRYRKSNIKTSLSNKKNIHIYENSIKSENYSSFYLEKVIPKIYKTTIVIKLEVNNLNGILLFNIPPIPSDRLWISFLNMPKIEFSATPHLGEYRVPFYKIKDKLEKKLRQIFHRYLVMPNMKDFIIPTINDYLSDIGIIKVISSRKKIYN